MTQTKFMQLYFVAFMILTAGAKASANTVNCQNSLVPSNFLFREGFENFDKGFVKDETYLYSKSTHRLVVGPLNPADRALMLRILKSPDSDKSPFEPHSKKSIVDDLTQMTSELHATDVSLRFVSAIYRKDTMEPIGAFWLNLIPSSASASIAYVIAPEYQSRGYAAEIVNGVVEDLLHSAYPLQFLFAVASDKNTASVMALESNGFSKHSPVSEKSPFNYYVKLIGK